MVDMIERVASAFYDLNVPSCKGWRRTWSESDLETQYTYKRQAHSIIKLMRIPTDSMMAAGGLKCEAMMFEDAPEGTGVIFKDMGVVFTAMIDQALKEG